MTLDPQLGAMLAFLDSLGAPPLEAGQPQQARASFRALTCDAVAPDQVVPVAQVDEVTIANRPARVYRPVLSEKRPTIVFFHGGGWVIGDLDTHDQGCRRLARDTGAVVVSIDYPLAPEHPFPAAVEHAITATAEIIRDRREYGGKKRIAVAGDSAGGNLAAVVAQTLSNKVRAQLLIYPAVDVGGDYPSRAENAEGYFLTAALMEWFVTHYLSGVDLDELDHGLRDPRLSPRHGELSGLPPAVVATAGYDPLRDEGIAYAEALRRAGVKVDAANYPSLIHGFIDMTAVSEAAAAAMSDLHARFARLL